MKKIVFGVFVSLFLALSMKGFSQNQVELTAADSVVETKMVVETSSGRLFGTLASPQKFSKMPVALIIAGSGPTDRDGNNIAMKNNSLNKLAHELSQNGIASLRYDKRGVAESKESAKSETDLRFEDYVSDAKKWIELLKSDKRFSKVIVIGHSEGSLIGMLAGTSVDKFISLAGAGQSADKILKGQLSAQPKMVQDAAFPIIDSLKNGKTCDNVPPMLQGVFRPTVQPYLISWFKYDPQNEIQKLKMPVLIVQGTNDIQVSVEEAKRLATAQSKAEMILIENMNHIFRIIDGDKQANIASYGKADLPISDKLVKSISTFILKN